MIVYASAYTNVHTYTLASLCLHIIPSRVRRQILKGGCKRYVCRYCVRLCVRASALPLSFTASEEADRAIYTTRSLARTHAQAQAQAQTRPLILYSKHDALETWTCGDCRRLLAVDDVRPNASFRTPCVCPPSPPPFPSEVSDSAMLALDPCMETCPEIMPPPLFPPPLLAPRPFVRPACSHECTMRGQTCAWHTRMCSPLLSVAHAPASAPPELDAKQSRVEMVLSGGLSTLTSAREVDEDG